MNNDKIEDAISQAQKIAGVEITDRARAVLSDKEKIKKVLSKLDKNDIALLTAIVTGQQTAIDKGALERIKTLLEE